MSISNPITRLPVKGNGTQINTDLIEAGLRELEVWDSRMQAFAKSEGRADANWIWPKLHRACAFWEKLRRRKLRTFQYMVHGVDPFLHNKRIALPVAQVMVAAGYPYCMDKSKKCVMLWKLAKVPDSALHPYQLPNVSVFKQMIDVAIQHSIDTGTDGRIMLHAAQAGGQDLMDSYSGIGLLPVPRNVSILTNNQPLRLPAN
jgi:hypothetical protein